MNNFTVINQKQYLWIFNFKKAFKNGGKSYQWQNKSIKQLCEKNSNLLQFNLSEVINQIELKTIQANKYYGNYEMYTQIPICVILEGTILVQCINLNGDIETIQTIKSPAIIQINAIKLEDKFGIDNINLLTRFRFHADRHTLLIDMNIKSASKPVITMTQDLSQQEKVIINRFLMISMKYVNKYIIEKGTIINQPVYMLSGKSYYYELKDKNKLILCCYEQGYLNPKAHTNFKLYIAPNSLVIELEKDFIRDDYVHGIQMKRQEHLQAISKQYLKMQYSQQIKLQQKLLLKYKISQINQNKSVKNCLGSTNTSIKRDKCNIRIRKKKKIN